MVIFGRRIQDWNVIIGWAWGDFGSIPNTSCDSRNVSKVRHFCFKEILSIWHPGTGMELELGDWTGWLGKTNISEDPRVFSLLYSIREKLFWPTYLISMCHFFMNISDRDIWSGTTFISQPESLGRTASSLGWESLQVSTSPLNMELFEFVDVNIKHLHPEAEPQLMTLKSGWA